MESAFSGDLSFFTLFTDFINEVGKDYYLLPLALITVGTPNDNISIPSQITPLQQTLLKATLKSKDYIRLTSLRDEISFVITLEFAGSDITYTNTIVVTRYFTDSTAIKADRITTEVTISSQGFNVRLQKSPIAENDNFLQDFFFSSPGALPTDRHPVIGNIIANSIQSNQNFLTLKYDYSGSITEINEAFENQTPLLGKCNQKGLLTINYTTDSFGGNLAEIIIAIADDKFYPNPFSYRLVAINKGIHVVNREDDKLFTFYAKRPKVVLTLLEDGEYDLQRVVKIKQVFGITESLYNFYNNIMTYASLKYGLAGLITGKFSIKWLYAKNNAKFFKLLAGSDFASTIVFFEPFVGYVQYFRWSK